LCVAELAKMAIIVVIVSRFLVLQRLYVQVHIDPHELYFMVMRKIHSTRFPVASRRRESCQLVTDLLATRQNILTH